MTQYIAQDLLKRLRDANFVEVRIAGDHHIFKNMNTGHMVPVPYTRKKDTIAPGTAHAILRVIKKSEEQQ